jgi:hypothetical protein
MSALDLELATTKDDSDEDDDLEEDALADKEKQAAAFNELLHNVFVQVFAGKGLR